MAMTHHQERPFRVVVLCTGNSARSQIGEALLATYGAGRVVAVSAGSHPVQRVNPFAVEVLRQHGIAWEDRVPKQIDAVLGEHFDLVITVCDNARESCPVLPGARAQVHWGLPDPAEYRDPSAARMAFASTFDALAARVNALLLLPLETLEAQSLRAAAQAVHDRARSAPAPG
jgi:arsenate reductase (thioredoxin)